MEKKIATLEKSLCQGIAKGETSSIANRQKNIRTEAISTVEFPAQLFRVFLMTTFKQNTEIKAGGKND